MKNSAILFLCLAAFLFSCTKNDGCEDDIKDLNPLFFQQWEGPIHSDEDVNEQTFLPYGDAPSGECDFLFRYEFLMDGTGKWHFPLFCGTPPLPEKLYYEFEITRCDNVITIVFTEEEMDRTEVFEIKEVTEDKLILLKLD